MTDNITPDRESAIAGDIATADNAARITTWPYSACSGLLDRELADNIRAWALTRMSEAELRSYSQLQLLRMYFSHHIIPTLQKVAPWIDREAIVSAEGS